MSIQNITLAPQNERQGLCLRAESYDYICYCSDCCQNSSLSEQSEMLDSRKFGKSEELLILWYRKTIDLGRKYIKGWVKRSQDTLNISFNEFESFLYILKMTGSCNFMKRNKIYDDMLSIINRSGTTTIDLINRKRFNLVMIAWTYVNQSFFRGNIAFYEELLPFFQVECSIIRKFESYYVLKF